MPLEHRCLSLSTRCATTQQMPTQVCAVAGHRNCAHFCRSCACMHGTCVHSCVHLRGRSLREKAAGQWTPRRCLRPRLLHQGVARFGPCAVAARAMTPYEDGQRSGTPDTVRPLSSLTRLSPCDKAYHMREVYLSDRRISDNSTYASSLLVQRP